MKEKLRVLFAAFEAAPFMKTGGLGDVAASLPGAVQCPTIEMRVVLPKLRQIPAEYQKKMKFLCSFYVPLGWRSQYCGLFELRRGGVTWYFLDNEYYFGRDGAYGYFDDGERMAFFAKAICECCRYLPDFFPNILHCNDWHTALAPVFLREQYRYAPGYSDIRTVFTIHNLKFQGQYNPHVLSDILGLDGVAAARNQLLRDDGKCVNYLAGAVSYSDRVTTVSPTYAKEICTPYFGEGLQDLFLRRHDILSGILNGIDMDLYDPAACADLPEHYSAKDLTGKAACKAALQRSMGLQEDPYVPLIGCVSRLVGHKGFSLVTDALHDIMGLDVQMVVLGTGEWQYEEAFRNAQGQYPGRFAAHLAYSPALSNLVYAGSDLFLMPSVSEPCGLSQLIAMRFGSVPVVRETGGLKDTVPPYNKYTGEGRGFTFTNINAGDMVWVLREAAALYRSNKPAWRSLQKAGMTADFSWGPSAKQYLEVYRRAMG